MVSMFKQFLQNSLAILRRPTVKSFQEVNVDNWQQAFIYLASNAVLKWLIVIVSNFIHGPDREKQLSEAPQHFRSDLVLSLHHSLQNPFMNLVVTIVMFLVGILLWFLLPYWLGQALGGSKSFGK